jgi:hypothetical protein
MGLPGLLSLDPNWMKYPIFTEELYPYYRRILEHKPLLIWEDLTPEDIDFVARRLNRQALALLPVVSSRQQAEEIWRRLKAG